MKCSNIRVVSSEISQSSVGFKFSCSSIQIGLDAVEGRKNFLTAFFLPIRVFYRFTVLVVLVLKPILHEWAHAPPNNVIFYMCFVLPLLLSVKQSYQFDTPWNSGDLVLESNSKPSKYSESSAHFLPVLFLAMGVITLSRLSAIESELKKMYKTLLTLPNDIGNARIF